MRTITEVTFKIKKSQSFIDRARLNERQKRAFYGFLSSMIGYGGNAAISHCLGVSPATAYKSLLEFKKAENQQNDRIRRPGGGRKKITISQSGLSSYIENLIEANSYGNPEAPLRWTTLSLRKIAESAGREGFKVNHVSVGQVLEELGYSKQANQKMLQVGKAHPNRVDQFKFINETVSNYLEQGIPVISIDCKKKENIGNFKNRGKEYRKKQDARKVLDHDFVDQQLGKVAPYGVYVLNNNTAFVNVGTDHDTAEFASQSIMDWWYIIGQENFPKTKKLLITCDGGGSNGCRNRLWKFSLASLAETTGLQIQVSHFPPGTSKWNKIEHRLFSYISNNWEGKPLIDIQTVVSLIASTTTKSGLKVQCQVDRRAYETGKKITDEQLAQVDIEPIGEFGQWNYIIRGFKKLK